MMNEHKCRDDRMVILYIDSDGNARCSHCKHQLPNETIFLKRLNIAIFSIKESIKIQKCGGGDIPTPQKNIVQQELMQYD